MGAVTAILAARNNPDIKAIVADSPFSKLYQLVNYYFLFYFSIYIKK